MNEFLHSRCQSECNIKKLILLNTFGMLLYYLIIGDNLDLSDINNVKKNKNFISIF